MMNYNYRVIVGAETRYYETLRGALKYLSNLPSSTKAILLAVDHDERDCQIEVVNGKTFKETYKLTIDKNWLLLKNDHLILTEARTWEDTDPCWY